MKYNARVKLREIAHKNKLLSKLYAFASIQKMRIYKGISDEEYVKRKYKEGIGKELNLDNPTTYNEKLQWLKLNDRNPLYTTLVDKYRVKKYVTDIVGEGYVIPTVGGPWNNASEIEREKLPKQFVLKCNHDCGSIIICTDKEIFDFKKAQHILQKKLEDNYYLMSREWPYKNVRPVIFAEEYMVDESGTELKDYKFFCFNGEPRFMFIASERMREDTETKFDFFDMDFNHLPFTQGHPNADITPKKPESFEKMKEMARKLTAGIPHVRIDFYEIKGKPYFGEMTFYHWGGIVPFQPEEWDNTFGRYIDLPQK